MGNKANVRVMEEDRNLIIRAIRLLLSGGRRFSFLERTDKLDEYEDAWLKGHGEKIIEDLTAYKDNSYLFPEQIREADDLIVCFERRIREIRQIRKEEMEAEERMLIEGSSVRL